MGDSAQTSAGYGVAALEGVVAYKEAARQAELNNAVKAFNNQQVYASMLSTYQSLEVQADQVGEAFIANSIDQQKMEARTRGAAVAASGASGTGGTGLDMQMQEASTESAMNTARMQMNKERQMNSIRSHAADATNLANQRLDRMPKQEAPSLLATAANVGVNGFRNTIALNNASKAYDRVYGEDEGGVSFTTEDLIDSKIEYNTPTTIYA